MTTPTANNNRYFKYFTYIRPVTRIPIVRTYGSMAFTVVALIVFILAAIKPTVETISDLQKKVETEKGVLKQITQKAEDLSNANINYGKLVNNNPEVIKAVKTALPQSIELNTVVSSLEQSIASESASISALNFQPIIIQKQASSSGQTLTSIDFTFNIEGDYQSLKDILQKIKTSPRIMSIENLSFSKVQSGNDLLMSMTGKALYLK